jgi:Lon protease-like protein
MSEILMSDSPLFSSEALESETELIPLITAEDEELMNAEKTPPELPILPLRNTVLFPGVVIPITVGRDRSIRLIQDVYRGDRTLGVLSQKDSSIEEPRPEDLNTVGTIATIVRMLRMPDGSTTAVIQGKKRFEMIEMVKTDPYFTARVKEFSELRPEKGDKSFDALISSLKDLAVNIIKASPHIPSEASFALKNIDSPSFLVNFISREAAHAGSGRPARTGRAPAGTPHQGAADAGDEERDSEQGAHRSGQAAARILPAPADQDHPGRAGRQSHRTGDRGDEGRCRQEEMVGQSG